jgi:hypothetical protein
MPDGDRLDVIFAVKYGNLPTRILTISGGGKYVSAAECLRICRASVRIACCSSPLPASN